jgi:hypothetical protein
LHKRSGKKVSAVHRNSTFTETEEGETMSKVKSIFIIFLDIKSGRIGWDVRGGGQVEA